MESMQTRLLKTIGLDAFNKLKYLQDTIPCFNKK